MINVDIIKLAQFSTNCYLVSSGDECVLIDPGADALDDIHNIRNAIGEKTLLAVLFTHGHYDHIAGGYCFSEAKYLHFNDFELAKWQVDYALENHNFELRLTNFSELFEGELNFGDMHIQVMLTPGHTMGSVCFLIDDYLFSGDTIFDGTCGRTDVGGNNKIMKETLKKFLELNPDLKLYPGHGRSGILRDQFDWIEKLI